MPKTIATNYPASIYAQVDLFGNCELGELTTQLFSAMGCFGGELSPDTLPSH